MTKIRVRGAREHNLDNLDVDFDDALTAVTGVSGSGKSSLVFDTIYHEARRRFFEVYAPPSSVERLAPAAVREIDGLRPVVAIGQNLLNRNPASTLATAVGLHPYLRILYASFGERRCSSCGSGVLVVAEEDVVRRLADGSKSDVRATLVRGARGSHATLRGALADSFGAANVLIDGTEGALEVDPDAPHDVQVRLASAGPRSAADGRALFRAARAIGADEIELADAAGGAPNGVGEQRFALAPVCTRCGTWFTELTSARFRESCPACGGAGCGRCAHSGIHPEAAAVVWREHTLHDFLTLSVEAALLVVDAQPWSPRSRRLGREIRRRLVALDKLGLGYLSLNRPAPSLSRGEGQRVRLAVVITSELGGLLHVLDEPSVGLHPADVGRVVAAMEQLRGPVIVVEHDRLAVARADRVIDIGPAAGPGGGHIVFDGTPHELWAAETATGKSFRLAAKVPLAPLMADDLEFLSVDCASSRNLQNLTVPFARGALNVVSGVSGSGKSTLVRDVMVATLDAGHAVGCQSVSGFKGAVVLVDQSPIGRNPRSNPATYTKLADTIRDGFAAHTDLSSSHFTFNRAEGACPECKGIGATEIKMRYLPSTWVRCEACGGRRFSDEVLERRVRIRDRSCSIVDLFDASVDEALDLLGDELFLSGTKRRAALKILGAMADVGLGYLRLGQPSPSLSGGEAQRVKLARHLGRRNLADRMIVFDEPTTGLHSEDVARLLRVFRHLVEAGATLVVVEHDLDVIRAADWIVDLGPGAGPDGGRLLHAGPLPELLDDPVSRTAQALREADKVKPRRRPRRGRRAADRISVRKASAHNLQDVDVDFDIGALTVVTGVSGSGKSSLVRDVLEVEARRRFLESLSMYERQGVGEGAEPEVGALDGLGVTMPLASSARLHNPRSTVGLTTEISQAVAALFARLGRRRCPSCNALMDPVVEGFECACGTTAAALLPRHFVPTVYGSACLTCHGVGSLRDPAPDKLIKAPDKPLCAGAMYSPGFYPQGFFGKPFNSGYDILQTLAKRYGFDPFATPWRDMPEAGRQAFLFGLDGPFEVTFHSRKGRISTRETRFNGFFGLIQNWDLGGTYTTTRVCPECRGGRLRAEYLAVHLAGVDIATLSAWPLDEVSGWLRGVEVPQSQRHVIAAQRDSALLRSELLCELGLGYLSLDRATRTLSAGEAQRLGLARILAGGLTGLTVLMDEPSRGMHPLEVERLVAALRRVTAAGNTAIVVEHDLTVIAAADRVVDMGPGAGAAGGRVVASAPPRELGPESLTGRWLRQPQLPTPPERRRPAGWLSIVGARANNLANVTARIPLGVLAGVCGVSGSGKSTLIMDTLARVVAPKKITTSVARETLEPGLHDAVEGAPRRSVLLDQSREGIVSPASFLGLKAALQKAFSDSEAAKSAGLDRSAFTERCSACGGSGSERIDMGFLPSLHSPCEACMSTGYTAELWEVKVRGRALPELMRATFDEVYLLWGDVPGVTAPLELARAVGLGYMVMQQPARALSGGEAQRLRIARELGKKTTADLYLLDEPTLGQHMQDIARLVTVLNGLVERGASVVVVEHSAEFLAACDWLLELGPGGGPNGGRIVAEGTPENVAEAATATAPYLAAVL